MQGETLDFIEFSSPMVAPRPAASAALVDPLALRKILGQAPMGRGINTDWREKPPLEANCFRNQSKMGYLANSPF